MNFWRHLNRVRFLWSLVTFSSIDQYIPCFCLKTSYLNLQIPVCFCFNDIGHVYISKQLLTVLPSLPKPGPKVTLVGHVRSCFLCTVPNCCTMSPAHIEHTCHTWHTHVCDATHGITHGTCILHNKHILDSTHHNKHNTVDIYCVLYRYTKFLTKNWRLSISSFIKILNIFYIDWNGAAGCMLAQCTMWLNLSIWMPHENQKTG